MRMQRTINQAVQCSGVGLHTGQQVSLRLLPAPVLTGIVFIRKGTEGVARIKVGGEKVIGTELCTSIGENGFRIQTVEHLLSTLSGLRIDNLFVEVDSSELPILDGSAEPFVALILKAGIKEQKRPQPTIRITRPIEVRQGDKFIILHPSEDRSGTAHQLIINCTIRFNKPLAIDQKMTYINSPEAFVRQIAKARTFGFLHEVQSLWSRGLAKGGSLKNAVVVSESGVINHEGLRYKDEFVRHKILDLLGDLSLLGRPIAGTIEAFCPGHQLNTLLVSEIMKSPDCWVLDEDSMEPSEVLSSRSKQHATGFIPVPSQA
jgi:UDP-3-O-[3-hydroxymyristoyl] N-acetylglucosamine deacetylase